MKNYIIASLCVMFFGTLNAQLTGVVYGSDKKTKDPIYGAKVKLLHAGTGVITGEEGKFEIILPRNLPDTLVFTAIGFYPDTIIVDKKDRFVALEVILFSDQLLPEVVASARRASHSISRLKTLHVETIDSDELRKAACCNLSESFETNASVDVNITDAVSGAKKIQMMGLDGVYTQIQMENIPYLRGLESAFGLNSISGTWVESIQITKGTGNVVNGYESMAGLINLELKKPQSMEKVYFNLYGNAMGRTELNFNSGFKLGEKWSSGWMIHGSAHPIEMDYNNDGFRDMPNGHNVGVLNRYHYQGKKMEAQFGFNLYADDKDGGQISSKRSDSLGYYGVMIRSRHADVFAKTGFFLKRPQHSIGVVYNFKYHEIDANFGNRKFTGAEKRGYINAIYDGIIRTTDHKFKLGASGVYIDMLQHMDSLSSDRIEVVPGIFGEYTYTGSRTSAVIGVRGDYHSIFGFQYAPRIHFKYKLTEWSDFRATGGRGWRVPNYMIDNISLLATSRQWIAPDTILPEISWNVGASFVQRFKLFGQEGSLVLDYYHTNFENQLIVDRDENVNEIVFKNLKGNSFSNSFQAELSVSPTKTLDLRFAYKYLDVKAEFGGSLQQKAMIPIHRGFFNIGYKTRNKRWEFDLTISVFGKRRLPVSLLADSTLTTVNESPIYPLLNAQITHVYKNWDFYVGGENIANYRQPNPIIDVENPFGSYFDATRIWAPIYGPNVYLGVRFSIKQKEEQ